MRKIKIFFACSMLFLTLSSCAQTSFVKLGSAKHGNTARRGILPRDENGNMIEPTDGHDFYAVEMIVKKSCTIETAMFWKGNSTCHPLTIDNQKTKIRCKKGDKIVFTANSSVQPRPAAPLATPKGEATLDIIINGKHFLIGIEKFEEILPE